MIAANDPLKLAMESHGGTGPSPGWRWGMKIGS
jgi:hypothetical protein